MTSSLQVAATVVLLSAPSLASATEEAPMDTATVERFASLALEGR